MQWHRDDLEWHRGCCLLRMDLKKLLTQKKVATAVAGLGLGAVSALLAERSRDTHSDRKGALSPGHLAEYAVAGASTFVGGRPMALGATVGTKLIGGLIAKATGDRKRREEQRRQEEARRRAAERQEIRDRGEQEDADPLVTGLTIAALMGLAIGAAMLLGNRVKDDDATAEGLRDRAEGLADAHEAVAGS